MLVVHVVVVGDVVSVIAVRRGMEGLEPDAGRAQARQVIQAARQSFEIANPVVIAVLILLDSRGSR